MISRFTIALVLLLCLGAAQREGPDLSALYTPVRKPALKSPKHAATGTAVRMVKAAVVPTKTVSLTWNAWPLPGISNYVHVIVSGSADLKTWYVVTNLPSSATGTKFAMTKPREFYRLGSDWGGL